MPGPIKERDWKYLRGISDAMLHALCTRVNRKAVEIVEAGKKNPHEVYGELYRHIEDSDKIVADCFNDWRRSNIGMKIIFLRRHGLLTDEHVQSLSESAQDWLSRAETPLDL